MKSQFLFIAEPEKSMLNMQDDKFHEFPSTKRIRDIMSFCLIVFVQIISHFPFILVKRKKKILLKDTLQIHIN